MLSNQLLLVKIAEIVLDQDCHDVPCGSAMGGKLIEMDTGQLGGCQQVDHESIC